MTVMYAKKHDMKKALKRDIPGLPALLRVALVTPQCELHFSSFRQMF